jgi:hypothetical protein
MPGIVELLLALLGCDVAGQGFASIGGGCINRFADLRDGALDVGSHCVLRFLATGCEREEGRCYCPVGETNSHAVQVPDVLGDKPLTLKCLAGSRAGRCNTRRRASAHPLPTMSARPRVATPRRAADRASRLRPLRRRRHGSRVGSTRSEGCGQLCVAVVESARPVHADRPSRAVADHERRSHSTEGCLIDFAFGAH